MAIFDRGQLTPGSLAWQFWVGGTVGTHLFVIKTRYELSASRNTSAATAHTIKDKNAG